MSNQVLNFVIQTRSEETIWTKKALVMVLLCELREFLEEVVLMAGEDEPLNNKKETEIGWKPVSLGPGGV